MTIGFTGGVASTTDQVDHQKSTQGAPATPAVRRCRAAELRVLPRGAVLDRAAADGCHVANGAGGLVVLSASALGYKIDSSLPSLVTTVLIGIGVDYFLFMTFRFRERLRAGDGASRPRRPPAHASRRDRLGGSRDHGRVRRAGLAQFGQFRVLGPSVAIAIFVMLLAGSRSCRRCSPLPAASCSGRPGRGSTSDKTDQRHGSARSSLAGRPASRC